MPLTRPRASQIDFDITNITDPLMRINSGETGTADKDAGIVIERGNDTNVAVIYDESADSFALINTDEIGTTAGNVTIASYAGLRANAIVYGSLNDGTTTLTSTIAELNYVNGVTSAIQTQLDAKLALAGGTMSGAIVMGTNKITGMGDPASAQDAATKAYVDSETSGIVTTQAIAGDSGTDNLTLGSDTLTFTGTANEVTTAVTNNVVTFSLPDDVTIGGNLVVTGNHTVNGTTTTVATTNMVVSDSLIELNNGASSNANDLGIVMERGSTGDNAIIAWDESADKFIVGTTTATGATTGDLSITTGTLVANIEGNVTGDVTGNTSGSSGSTTGNAATATALATTRAIQVSGAVTGTANFDGSAAINIVTTNTADPTITLGGELSGSVTLTNLASGTLTATVGTLNGLAIASTQTITMGSNRITNVADPVGNQDAATKAYVDANAGSGGGTSGFTQSTTTTAPGSDGAFALSFNVAQDTQETPFQAGGSDAFGVSLGEVYDQMEPVGTTSTVDYGAFT